MSRNTTIALAVVNAALFAFIMIYERGTLSTSDLAGRSGQVLSEFVRDQVEQVELVRGDEPAIVFVRERNEDEEEGLADIGAWNITEPTAASADQEAVDSLLGALEWLTPRRTLTEVSDEDRGQFGLTEPRFVVRFTVRAQNVEVAFGAESPAGGGVYVGVVGGDRVHVVDDEILEQLDHDLAHFRSKELFDGFFASDARALEVDVDGETLTFSRGQGPWLVTAPEQAWARRATVDGVLRVLRRARITRFVAEPGEDLAEYGLDEPWREVRAERGEDVEENRTARLRVGATCGEHEDERYAVADEGPVVCLTVGDVAGLEIDQERLREPRLLPVGDDAIEKIVLMRGDSRLELRREEAVWKLYLGTEDEPGEGQPADADAIAEWTSQLRGAEVEAFEGAEETHGTGEASATLVVHRNDRPMRYVLALGDADGDGAWVRRGAVVEGDDDEPETREDEPATVRFGADVAALLAADALRFRDRAVLSLEAGDVTRITRGDERAVKGEGGWQLEAPVEAEADRVVVGELLRRLSSLRAARLVSESPAREHALDEQTLELRLEPEDGDETTVRLSLGASTPEGRYARVDQGPVFVIGQEDLEAIEAPLVSRDLLTLVTEELSTIRVERDGQTYELTRDNTSWQPAGSATDALIDRLGTLRATDVIAYGAGAGALPTRVVATDADGAEVTLSFGAVDDDRVLVRRSGIDVTYAVRADAAGPILTYAP